MILARLLGLWRVGRVFERGETPRLLWLGSGVYVGWRPWDQARSLNTCGAFGTIPSRCEHLRRASRDNIQWRDFFVSDVSQNDVEVGDEEAITGEPHYP